MSGTGRIALLGDHDGFRAADAGVLPLPTSGIDSRHFCMLDIPYLL